MLDRLGSWAAASRPASRAGEPLYSFMISVPPLWPRTSCLAASGYRLLVEAQAATVEGDRNRRKGEQQTVTITPAQLGYLLEGNDWRLRNTRRCAIKASTLDASASTSRSLIAAL